MRLKQGQVVELAPKRAHGVCERWEAALEPGLARASMRIESEQGELLGEVDAERMRACMVVCAPAKTRRITLVGRAGFGSVALTGTVANPPIAEPKPEGAVQDSAGAAFSCACADDPARCSLSSGRR